MNPEPCTLHRDREWIEQTSPFRGTSCWGN